MEAPLPQPSAVPCPGCGAGVSPNGEAVDRRYHASAECLQRYSELSAYTTSLMDVAFLHQHAVDAYGAQHSGPATRPITTAFALVGLYLSCEQGASGRDVQRAHMRLARHPNDWPRFDPPSEPDWLTVLEPLAAPPGPARDEAVRRWAVSVWQAWAHERERVIRLVADFLY